MNWLRGRDLRTFLHHRASALRLITAGGLALVLVPVACDVAGRRATADPETAGSDTPAAARHAELHVRYAEARLASAVADLEKAMGLNRVVPGEVAGSEIDRLERQVTILREHVAVTRQHPHGNALPLAQAAARTTARTANDELAAARAANTRQAGAVSPLIVQQLEARAHLARTRLDILEDSAFAESPLQILQIQIDHLADQVVDLLQRTENAPTLDRR